MPEEQEAKPNEAGSGEAQGGKPATFSDWLQSQPPDVQEMFAAEIRGLKGALESERAQRKAHERELREAAKRLEEGSAARKELEAQADKLRALETQTVFYDHAHAAGCSNLRLAYIAARDAGLIRDDGTADWDTMRQRYPELFKPAPKGHAGAGTDAAGALKPAKRIDEYIRSAAGVRPR